jgi:uncharacterized membrane protein (DUF485 family)
MLLASPLGANFSSETLSIIIGTAGGLFGVVLATAFTALASRRADTYASEIRVRLREATDTRAGAPTAQAKVDPELDVEPATQQAESAVDLASRSTRRPEEDETYKILREYSAQGLGQSRVSFNVSIGFAALGFLVLVVGVLVAIFSKSGKSTAVIPVISGGIVEAVSALFFTVNARAQKVMVEFFDKLRDDRRIEEALRLRSTITDEAMANRLQVLLALQFVTADEAPALLRQIVDPYGESPGLAFTKSDETVR